VGLAAQRIYARKLRRMTPKKWPARKSRMTRGPAGNNSNANNLKAFGEGGATHTQFMNAINANNAQMAEYLRTRLAARPRSPRTAVAVLRESQRYENMTGFGYESGTGPPNARHKVSSSSGSSSRNSKTPSPSSSTRSRNASPGSAVSTGRKNNSLNK
jgi:glucan phosphoethanolaminetransferase (alkaline phosphatase superfamily)